jgi:hypothetical protein
VNCEIAFEEIHMELQDRYIRRWALVALVYFVAAVSLGVIMAATHDYRLKGVHVHLNLLGWVSMALTAFVYRLFPAACTAFGARVHFWLYSTALPVMAVSLGGLLLGDPRFEPAVAASSVAILMAIVTFAVTVFRHSSHRESRSSGELGRWNVV